MPMQPDSKQSTTNAKTGVLMIHGLMGSPKEYLGLASILQAEGYVTHHFSLPGHGDNIGRQCFKSVQAGHIIETCLNEYDRLATEVDQVVVLGHSLGGICSLIVGGHNPQSLAGVVSMSAPLDKAFILNYTHGYFQVPIATLWQGLPFVKDCFTGFERPSYVPWAYPTLHTEAKAMLSQLHSVLPNIDVPTCLIHAQHDLTIPYQEMHKIHERINKPHLVQTHTLERGGHQIFPKSVSKETATQHVLRFVHQVHGVHGAHNHPHYAHSANRR